MTRTPPVTCQADIDAMTQEQARQWLIANDREAADYWAELPADTDFREAVTVNCRDFGFDEGHVPGVTTSRSDAAPDRADVHVAGKFTVTVIRTDQGMVIDVYPNGWDAPLETFTVWDDDVPAAESEAA
ncbi:hypothetical protein J8F10_09185 [Gemmata sp. G18]|uniref:Nuclear transport factor 2 family protein n=1 Tax=Gemmata palustris TaxID=2822762 RepID=A0ABS5BNZ4_9BACT|nr:hypothetical protein [Gemmata palustris]MBP3955454.1 hypothetical protein [Gemmata palustris]